MKKHDLVAIGHNENVYVFNAIGIESLSASKEELINIINEKVELGAKIFFISQKFSEEVNEIRKTFDSSYPILLMLAMDEDELSVGVKDLAQNVEKATGIKLF